MAKVPFTLREQATLRRNTGYGTALLILQAGEQVFYECMEDDCSITHIVTCTRDGYSWRGEKKTEKTAAPATVTVPEPKVAPAIIAQPATPVAPAGCTKMDRWAKEGFSEALAAATVNQAATDAITTPERSPITGSLPSPTTQAAMNTIAQAAHAAATKIADRDTIGVDDSEKKVRSLDKVVKILQGKVYQVNYYIPSELDITNPSRVFRQAGGFHLDGSNWIFDEKGLNSKLVQATFGRWAQTIPISQTWQLAGFTSTRKIRWWITELSPEQINSMKLVAQDQLAEELIGVHRSLIERIDSAATCLKDAQDAAVTAKDTDKADNSYNAKIRDIIRDACETFESCIKGAEIFDDTGSLDALFGAVRDAIKTQAAAVNAALRAKRVKTVALPIAITQPAITS